MREERLFVNGWSFTRTDNDKKADINSIRNEEWQDVVIPHDWLIYDTRNLYQDGTGWYRNVFNLEKDETKEYLIYFDGVYMDNTVYVNGQVAGEWKYGYSSFEFNITNLLTDGENEIIVKVCFQAPNSRWYSGAGIFRDVIVKTVEKKRIATWGVYIHTAFASVAAFSSASAIFPVKPFSLSSASVYGLGVMVTGIAKSFDI